MNIIGVKNPYALVQKAGKRKTKRNSKNKNTKKNRKNKKSLKSTNSRFTNAIFL